MVGYTQGRITTWFCYPSRDRVRLHFSEAGCVQGPISLPSAASFQETTRVLTKAAIASRVQLVNVNTVTNKNGDLVVINRNGKLLILEDTTPKKGKKGEPPPAETHREKERYALVYGSTLKVRDGQHVEAGQALVEWDPFTSAILTEVGGKIAFKDIVEGENVREETDKVTGLTQMVIVEAATAEKRTPTLIIKAGKGSEERKYLLPTGAHVMVQNGTEVYPGDILAKIPRATTKTKDITGGLPRVVELFEARHPHAT